jgi:hypothetical protein
LEQVAIIQVIIKRAAHMVSVAQRVSKDMDSKDFLNLDFLRVYMVDKVSQGMAAAWQADIMSVPAELVQEHMDKVSAQQDMVLAV